MKNERRKQKSSQESANPIWLGIVLFWRTFLALCFEFEEIDDLRTRVRVYDIGVDCGVSLLPTKIARMGFPFCSRLVKMRCTEMVYNAG